MHVLDDTRIDPSDFNPIIYIESHHHNEMTFSSSLRSRMAQRICLMYGLNDLNDLFVGCISKRAQDSVNITSSEITGHMLKYHVFLLTHQ